MAVVNRPLLRMRRTAVLLRRQEMPRGPKIGQTVSRPAATAQHRHSSETPLHWLVRLHDVPFVALSRV